MLSPRTARFAYLPLMLLAMSLLGGVAARLFWQALSTGTGEALMAVWLLLFLVALPTLLLLLPVVAMLQAHRRHRPIVPLTGVKIPGAGQ